MKERINVIVVENGKKEKEYVQTKREFLYSADSFHLTPFKGELKPLTNSGMGYDMYKRLIIWTMSYVGNTVGENIECNQILAD